MAAEAMSRDPTFYENPDKFDGERFYRRMEFKDKETQSLENEFAGIERGDLAWGNGRLTCPGRWYASAMNKLIIGTILEQYDLKFPDNQLERPLNVYADGKIAPDTTQEIMFCRL